MLQIKYCSKCKETKPTEEFWHSSRSKDRFTRHCKSCKNATEKICKKCSLLKSLEDFTKLARGEFGRDTQCRDCKHLSEKHYYYNSDKIRKNRTRQQRVRKYNLTDTEYQNMISRQNNCCAICLILLDDTIDNTNTNIRPRIDHCHTTGIVRGILCGQCNVGLGHFYDNEESLLNAILYLRKYK